MLEGYSQRAKMIVFIARFKAAKNGAHAIGLDHLLEGIIVEDQGREAILRFLGDDPAITQIPHYEMKSSAAPFLSSQEARGLLAKLDQLSRHDKSVAESSDMPLSADAVRALHKAVSRAHELGADKVEPLHVLVAILQERSSRAVQVFWESGVTEDNVVAELTKRQ